MGLGDVVIPGVAVAFLRRFGEAVQGPYFRNALAAYALGLLAALAANTYLQNGQPALLYVVPSILLSAWFTAASDGEVPRLLSYREDREAAEDVPGLEAGRLLVAGSVEDDGMFGASVVLLLRHDHAAGSLGVVLNRRLSEADRALLVDRVRGLDERWLTAGQVQAVRSARELLRGDVRLGGPVGIRDFPFQTCVVVHGRRSLRRARMALRAPTEDGDLWWSYLSEWDPSFDSKDAVLFLGLSGWQGGQLAGEVSQAMWGLAAASPSAVGQPERLLERLKGSGAVRYFRAQAV
uniref:Uncharacterized protein n=1 Tax=Pyrodinium bahamense TaxID=73915 RepID=A0A7S0B7T3_9DINO